MSGKRYTRRYRGEEDLSKNIREMIAMIKNEEVSRGKIKYGKLELSKHALKRAKQFLGCSEKYALARVKNLLRRARRVGEQLSYEGRLNVLFVVNQYAIYLSPSLEKVITIRKFSRISYKPIKKQLPELTNKFSGTKLKKELVRLHKDALAKVERIEIEQQNKVVNLDKEIHNTIKKLNDLKQGYTPKHYRKYLNQRLNEEKEKLFNDLIKEGERLFTIKLEKRHIGKSIASILN
jgi:hypothetical protein